MWCRWSLSASGRAPLAVLIFHRVADDRANCWTTPTATFVKAIDWLQAHFELISLEEVQRRIASGANYQPSVSITFDDGYADNMNVALPLLIVRNIPCTYFVSAGPVLERVPFEHDVRMGNRFAPNSVAELRDIARGGIEIGAHTRTHADLGRVTEEAVMYDEVVRARDDLQDALGVRIRYFAFPFGLHPNLSADAFHMAREAGYDGVCSAYGGYNFSGGDAFHLQRRGVDGPLTGLKHWAMPDPFRPHRDLRVEPFHYEGRLSLREQTSFRGAKGDVVATRLPPDCM
jgi:peptidoglycan/xylan/chitin deacetylase (PgdA/CDA1 family)